MILTTWLSNLDWLAITKFDHSIWVQYAVFIENGLEGDANSGSEEDEMEDIDDGVEVEHLHILEEVFILSLYLN